MESVEMKCCNVCRKWLPVSSFSPRNDRENRPARLCKPCNLERGKKLRATPSHQEYLKAYRRSEKAKQAQLKFFASPKGAAAKALRNLKRRLKKQEILMTLTGSAWEQILKEHDFACHYCGVKDVPITQDHVIPISKGGPHSRENVVPACRPCNSRKKDRLLEQI